MIPEHFTPKLFSMIKKGYNIDTIKSDIVAGLTVAIVALPLSMALGIASGASPDKGLITAVIAGFLISFFGGSRFQIGGPTGAFIVVVFNIIAQYGYDGLILATILAGVILLIAGYAKFGNVIKYIPYPVITGFTAGIAIIIASSQVKDFFGLTISDVPAEFIIKWKSYFTHINTINWFTLLIGVTALTIIIVLKRYAPKLPGYIIALVVSSLLVYFFKFPVDTVGSRFPNISSSFPIPHMPAWDFEKFIDIVPSAFTIAFLAGIESLLSAVVADGMTGQKHRSNQELVAQGIANISSAFFGGMPATGAIARTATNIKSGGKTPLAGISHAIFLLIFIMVATDIMAFVPLAALSAILFIVAWNMSESQHFIHIYRLSKSDRIVMILTFSLTILVDLTVAIGVGVIIASLLFIREMNKSVDIHSQGRSIRDVSNNEKSGNNRDDLPKGVEVFRITGPIFFSVAGTMLETLKAIGETPRILIVRMKFVPFIDVAGLNALKYLIEECHSKGTIVIFSDLKENPANMLLKAGVIDNQENLFLSTNYDESIKLARKLIV